MDRDGQTIDIVCQAPSFIKTLTLLNVTGGIVHPYHLDESICSLRGF